jgi:hypothetical protein
MSVPKNSVSDRNSTRAPLAASAVFVGGMEDALHYDTVSVTIDADADAILIVQESTDGSYITSQTQFFYLTGSSMSFSHQLKTKYFNVRFVCGALPITTLQLQTIMRVSPAMPTSIEVTATELDIRDLSANTDGVEIFGLQGGVNKRAVVVDAAGHLQVDVRTMPAMVASSALAYRNINLQPTASQVGSGSTSLVSVFGFNNAAADAFLKLYDSVSAPDENSTPIWTLALQPNNRQDMALPCPVLFASGLWLRATTGIADNNTGAPGANTVIVALQYR